jgi:hypothetical protein
VAKLATKRTALLFIALSRQDRRIEGGGTAIPAARLFFTGGSLQHR